jgi:hypothetical protein
MAELSPLRRRMIEDMTVRNLSPATQRSYINAVQKFSRYFGRSPDRLDLEDVHAFQVHLVSTGISNISGKRECGLLVDFELHVLSVSVLESIFQILKYIDPMIA